RLPVPGRWQEWEVQRPATVVNELPPHGHRFRTRGERRLHIPLVATLEAAAVFAARLGGTRFGADVAAFGARIRNRFVPRDEIAVRVVRAPVEGAAALLRAELDQVPAILRAFHTDGERTRTATLREAAAPQEFARTALADVHLCPAELADFIREHRRLLVPPQRTGVVARGPVLARQIRAEEAAARHQPAAVLGTALRLEHGQVVRLRNEVLDVRLFKRGAEGAVELLQYLPPVQRSFLDLVQLSFHGRRESHVEDLGELAHHDLRHGFAQRSGREPALLQGDVPTLGQY